MLVSTAVNWSCTIRRVDAPTSEMDFYPEFYIQDDLNDNT